MADRTVHSTVLTLKYQMLYDDGHSTLQTHCSLVLHYSACPADGGERNRNTLMDFVHFFDGFVSVPVFVDDMANDKRGEEEQAVAGHGALRLHIDLMNGNDFPLRRGRLSHHLESNAKDGFAMSML